MMVDVHEFGLHPRPSPTTSDSPCYRPPSWPPPADWIVSLDGQGNPLSRWGDPAWNFSPWVGRSFVLDFAGGGGGNSAPPLGPQNQDLMRLLATWMIWGPRGDRAWRTVKHRFGRIRRIVALCEREGVLAMNLMRHPKLLQQVPSMYSSFKNKKSVVVDLDRLLRAEDQIGFALIDQSGICLLSKVFAESSDEETEQTAYIPPRIWTYQILRLKECIEDFLAHRRQIEDCFNFCVDAYAHNFGSLEAALLSKRALTHGLPFTKQRHAVAGLRSGRRFYGHFKLTASRFGIAELLERWVLPKTQDINVKSLSAYLTLVQDAGLAFIATFTLQRIDEAGSLRADCLIFEEDPELGPIAVICGETTKTDPDSDARWPTSPSVKLAVEAMTAVSKLRMRCAAENPEANCSEADQANPYLLHGAFEPWAPSRKSDYSTRPNVRTYMSLTLRFPRLFDPEQLRVTEDDFSKARMFTPNLDKGGKFKVGKVWPLAYHQLRRTGTVNMFASGLLSDSSIQFLLKHKILPQSFYYGRNHTRVRFNEEVEGLTTEVKYEVMAKQIEALVEDRYVSPAGPQRKQEIVVNLMSAKDYNTLAKAGKKGEVSFREIRLGGCTKRGHCDYGGIESVARCAGGDGDKPCRDAMFDRMKRSDVQRQLGSVELLLQAVQPDSPRERSLKADSQGMRNYLDVIRN